MPTPVSPAQETETFSMRIASRMSGVSPERIRAWESRHGALRPLRTAGGSRRYTLADVERLRLLLKVVDSGHRIGEVARFDAAELMNCLPFATERGDGTSDLRSRTASESARGMGAERSERFADVLEAVRRVDTAEILRLLKAKQEELGDLAFARDWVLPLLSEMGQAWLAGRISISAEHLASGIIRTLLVQSIDRKAATRGGPSIVFATAPGECHDLGMLVAALHAKRAGAVPIYLGTEIPDDDLLEAVRKTRAEVLAIGFVMLPPDEVFQILQRVRRALPESVALWIGGSGIEGCAPVRGVERVPQLDQIEAFVLELCTGVE